MNAPHLKLLKELSENNSQSQRELSRKLGLSLGSVNYVLSHLVEAGLIMYILTPAGQQFSVKPVSLANAGQECPAYRDRRGFPTPPDEHLPDISPRIAACRDQK